MNAERRRLTIMLVIWALIVVLSIFSEKITIGQGLGWDGSFYYAMIHDFTTKISERSLEPYYAARTLIPALVWLVHRVLRIAITPRSVTDVFFVINAIGLLVVILAWHQIGRRMALSAEAAWVGFAALIVNCFILKHLPYYPVLLDVPTYAMAMVALLAYLNNRTGLLFVIGVFGTLTNPLFQYIAAALLIFPRRMTDWSKAEIPPPVTLDWYWKLALAAVPGGAAAAYLGYINYIRKIVIVPIQQNFALLAILAIGIFITSALLPLADSISRIRWRTLIQAEGLRRLAYVALIVLAEKVLVWTISHTVNETMNVKIFLEQSGSVAISKPFLFFVSHAVFWGPLFVCMPLVWPQTVRAAERIGIGFSAVVAFAILLCVRPEGRNLIVLYPFLVVPAVKALDSVVDRRNFAWFFLVTSILASRIWIVVNTAPLYAGTDVGPFQDYPWQSYLGSYGYMMGDSTYLASLTICVGLMAFMYLRFFWRGPGQARIE